MYQCQVLHNVKVVPRGHPTGECLACYLCVKYLISSPKFILTTGGGGATTTGPDATPPPSYLSKLAGGGAGGQLEGGRLEGVGGGVEDLGGGGFGRGGRGAALLHNSHQQLPQTRPRHTSPLEVCMWL